MTSVNGNNAMMPYPGKVIFIEDIGPEIKSNSGPEIPT